MTYDAIVFDSDGVLVGLSNADLKQRGIEAALAAHGVMDPVPEDIEALDAITAERAREVARRHGLDAEELIASREREVAAAQREAMETGEKRPYDDTDVLKRLDRPLGIVSNNQHRTIENVCELFGFGDLVDTYYGREPTPWGIDNRKPEPAYLRRALSDLDASNALYVGDSNVDIRAARAAGMDVVFLRRDHRTGYELVAEPTAEIRSLDRLPSVIETAERSAG